MSPRAVRLRLSGAAPLAVAVFAAIVLTLGGCGGSGSATTSSKSGASPGSAAGGAPPGFDPQALQQFTSCMRKQGVSLPGPGGPPGGAQGSAPPAAGGGFPAGAKARQALQTCRHYLPQGRSPAPPASTPSA